MVRTPFGAAVWAGGYVVLPLLGVYKPIWKYDLKTLGKDLGAHLVFGTATAATFCLPATGSTRDDSDDQPKEVAMKAPEYRHHGATRAT